MSENVSSHGHVGILVKPMNDSERENFNKNSVAFVNYEGTLVFTRHDLNNHGVGLFFHNGSDGHSLIAECAYQIAYVKQNTIRPYFANWYNGVDNPMSELTLKKFKKQKKFNLAIS